MLTYKFLSDNALSSNIASPSLILNETEHFKSQWNNCPSDVNMDGQCIGITSRQVQMIKMDEIFREREQQLHQFTSNTCLVLERIF